MTKIEPVSKAAADYFMNQAIHGEGNFYSFLYAHGLDGYKDKAQVSPQFAAFCRQVADQIDPAAAHECPGPLQYDCVRRVYRAAYKLGHNTRSKMAYDDDSISDQAIDLHLQKQGLLGYNENDQLAEKDESGWWEAQYFNEGCQDWQTFNGNMNYPHFSTFPTEAEVVAYIKEIKNMPEFAGHSFKAKKRKAK